MVEKIQRIYTSTVDGAFEKMLHSAVLQVDAAGLIKLAIFNQPADNCGYRQDLETIDKVTTEIFGEQPPLTSYIAQKTSHGGVTVEATYIADKDAIVEYHRNYRLITINGCTEVMTGGIVPRVAGGSTFEQSALSPGLSQDTLFFPRSSGSHHHPGAAILNTVLTDEETEVQGGRY